MPKKKKTTASGEPVMVQSVRRTRSRRMKFCVHGGLGGYPQQAAPEAEWLSRSIACRFLVSPCIYALSGDISSNESTIKSQAETRTHKNGLSFGIVLI